MAPPKGGFAPTLEKFLDTLKSRPVDASVEFLVSLLKRRQIRGSEPCAMATAHILLQVVAKEKWTDVDQLIGRIQLVGKKLVAAQPHELAIGNIIRRVLGLIRDEAEEDRNDTMAGSPTDLRDAATPLSMPSVPNSPTKPIRPPTLSSLGSFARTQSVFNLLSDPDLAPTPGSNVSTPGLGSDVSTPFMNAQSTNVYALRSEVIDGIEEIMDEIKQVDEQVQSYAEIFIHPTDYIMVYQPSKTLQKFLTRAASKRKFTLFLAADPSTTLAPEDPYASFKKTMGTSGCLVVTVMNCGFAAYMSRANKVIIEARAITGKGGVVVDGSGAALARAARVHERTVIVLGGVYKLSPETQPFQKSSVEWGDPSKYVDFADGTMVSDVNVKNAVSEFVPAEHVDIYITNLGAHTRDHFHSIVMDHYKEEDIHFELHGKGR
ncbi:initiation factor 2 subunit family protein [Xylariaceae sp. FL0804]|nr:initiation factor 2 subunit family protein [Xylariaceae sp. FL0804]